MSIDVTASHSSDSVTIRFGAIGSDRGNWWGIQDVQILAAYSWPSPPQPPSPPGIWAPGFHFEDRWPEATGWRSSTPLRVTNCGVLGTMAGGYQVFGANDFVEKAFTGLPPHSSLRVLVTYTRIDTLPIGLLFVDGVEVWRRTWNYLEAKSINACGSASGGASNPHVPCIALGIHPLAHKMRASSRADDYHSSQNEIQDFVDVEVDHYSENVTIRAAAEGSEGYFGIQHVKLSSSKSLPLPPSPPSPPGTWNALARDHWPPGATGWNTSLGVADASMVTGCPGVGVYLGGKDKFSVGDFIEKTFDSLDSHTALRIRAKMIMINGYSYKLQMLVDGSSAWESFTTGTWNGHLGDVCGGSGSEWVHEIDMSFPHSAGSATIRFTSTVSSSTSFWGLNDVEIELVSSHPSPPAPPSPPGAWVNAALEVWPGASGWTGSMALDASTITTCGSLGTMIGGYGKFSVGDHLEKTYGSLPTHTGMRIRATLFKIDKWNSKVLQMFVDGSAAWQSTPYTTHGQAVCGDMGHQRYDQAVDVDVTVAHSAGSATIRFTSTVSSSTSFWGLQGVAVQLVDES